MHKFLDDMDNSMIVTTSDDNTWYYNNKPFNEYYSVEGRPVESYVDLGAAKNEVDTLNDLRKQENMGFIQYLGKKNIAEVSINENGMRKELPPGQYLFVYGDSSKPSRLIPTNFRKDKYIALPSITDSIITDINEFINNEPLYRSIDPEMCYKMGTLLYGPPGEGKTSLIRNIIANHLPSDAVTIIIGRDNFPYSSIIDHIRKTLKNRLKVFIFEELTTYTGSNANAEQLLSFLDGENSLDKSIIFATTNYPELLPGNIVDRASRIDKMYKIESPNDEERGLILSHYLKRQATEEEILAAHGVSTAYLKEIAITSLIKKISILESVILIESRKLSIKNNFKSDSKFGLSNE